MFCLPKIYADKIKKAVKNGYLNPERLNTMTSQERRNFFATIVGQEQAKPINLLFEKKILLKNQERAIYDYIREITGMSKEQKEATAKKIRETYAEKKRMVENPSENEKVLSEVVADVYEKKYKTEISLKEAEIITKLSSNVISKKEKLGDTSKWMTEDFVLTGTEADAIKFGSAQTALEKYTGDLKKDAKKKYFEKFSTEKSVRENIVAFTNNFEKIGDFMAENTRALKASFDNSFFGRQGRKVLTRPATSKIWWKLFGQSFRDIGGIILYGNKNGDAILDATISEIYSRENYMKGRYDSKEGKLDIGNGEEEFPTSAPSKIPILGRLFKSSEIAFEASAMRMRADVADVFYKLKEKTGADLTDKFEVGSINKVVNDMTGRGKGILTLGSEELQKKVNTVFFSPKFAQSQINTLFSAAYFRSRSSFAQKQAAYNLLSLVSSSAIMMAIAYAIKPDAVEWDPNSADFCKIKVGNTRFDLGGGTCSYITLLSRAITGKTKSSVTGITKELGKDYGSQDRLDIFWDFIENKTAPLTSVLKNIYLNKTFDGEKVTPVNITTDLTVPIVIETGTDAAETEGVAVTLLALIADGIGVSANTYTYKTNWEKSSAKWTAKWKEEKGVKSLKEANKKYNNLVNDKILELRKDEEFKKKSDEDKLKELTKEKTAIKKDIFKEYRFKE